MAGTRESLARRFDVVRSHPTVVQHRLWLCATPGEPVTGGARVVAGGRPWPIARAGTGERVLQQADDAHSGPLPANQHQEHWRDPAPAMPRGHPLAQNTRLDR